VKKNGLVREVRCKMFNLLSCKLFKWYTRNKRKYNNSTFSAQLISAAETREAYSSFSPSSLLITINLVSILF